MVKVKCEMCGKNIYITPYRLKRSKYHFCSKGCHYKSKLSNKAGKDNSNYKHGLSNSNFYPIWHSMIQRCTNKKNKNYNRYGSRGITVCDKWLDFQGFMDDMYDSYLKRIKEFGKKQATIDRIDNSKGYYKQNCEWVDRITQARNRESNHLLTYQNVTMPIVEWAEHLTIPHARIRNRIKANWPLHLILSPKKYANQHNSPLNN